MIFRKALLIIIFYSPIITLADNFNLIHSEVEKIASSAAQVFSSIKPNTPSDMGSNKDNTPLLADDPNLYSGVGDIADQTFVTECDSYLKQQSPEVQFYNLRRPLQNDYCVKNSILTKEKK